MRKQLLFILPIAIFSLRANAQLCNTSGFCTNITNEHQYPAATYSTTSSTWITVNTTMNADNYTLFNVISGNTYEWSYCESYGGVSTGWDAQLTLSDNSTGTNLCFSDNVCGTNNNAPYISWVATFTGVVKLLTSQAGCASNSGSPYNTLVWRMANGVATTQILGIDVSTYQGTITWSQVKNTSTKIFAWAKASEGVTGVDNTFVNNMTNGEAAGVYMGGYHFSRAETNSAASEAAHFLSVAGTYIKSCELIPALDLEDPPSGTALTAYFTSPVLTQWVQDWMTAVKTQTGITPILYTGGSIASYLGTSVKTYPLWIADPDNSSTAQPTNIGGWSTWAFKQYSWTGVVSGISGNVDSDVFNGDITALNALMGCATGVAENSPQNNFKIYPNPANDNITVENISSNGKEDEMISIYNIQGQLLLQQLMQQQKTEINISGFANGLYIVKLKTENGPDNYREEVKKFIKE